MDPTAMMSDGGYAAEIWRLGGEMDLRRGQFGEGNVSREREVSGSGSSKRGGDDVAKAVSTSNENGVRDCEGKRVRTHVSREENLDSETEPEANSIKQKEKNTKLADPPKQDYIHVRARRGQATDSHSLAERARREKISERMKILQDLVPGCNKGLSGSYIRNIVLDREQIYSFHMPNADNYTSYRIPVIGKASVLDEIINYIQSLQRQVEFLSMKLEAVNSRMDPGIQGFPSKDFVQQTYDTPGVAFGSQTMRDFGKDSSPEWLHMQLGGGYERTT